jgi:hypothetical protein
MSRRDGLPELSRLLRRLGNYQSQINAELAKGAKADHDKIEAAYAAGREFARDAAPYCHSTPADQPAPRMAAIRDNPRLVPNLTTSCCRA